MEGWWFSWGLVFPFRFCCIKNANDSPKPPPEAQNGPEAAAAYAVMEKFFKASKNQPPSPELVRDVERITPLWTWYYSQPESNTPGYALQGYLNPRIYQAGGRQMMALKVVAKRGFLDVLFEKAGDGWKVDWEAFSGVHGGRWQMFLNQDCNLGSEGDYCVHVEQMPDALIMQSFLERNIETRLPGTKILKVFCADQSRDVAAIVLTATNPMAGAFADISPGKDPVRMILRLRLVQQFSYPPVVELTQIVQNGWGQAEPPK